jgi:hypothetical protein
VLLTHHGVGMPPVTCHSAHLRNQTCRTWEAGGLLGLEVKKLRRGSLTTIMHVVRLWARTRPFLLGRLLLLLLRHLGTTSWTGVVPLQPRQEAALVEKVLAVHQYPALPLAKIVVADAARLDLRLRVRRSIEEVREGAALQLCDRARIGWMNGGPRLLVQKPRALKKQL